MRIWVLLRRYRRALHKLNIEQFIAFSSNSLWNTGDRDKVFFDIFYDCFPEFYNNTEEARKENSEFEVK